MLTLISSVTFAILLPQVMAPKKPKLPRYHTPCGKV